MLRIYALPVSALLFLFSGLYKGLIWSPVDLTVAAAALVAVTLLPHRSETLPLLASRVPALLGILTACLALRLVPDFPAWGVRKLAETVLFGLPALIAGAVIARHHQRAFTSVVAWSCVPLAVGVAAMAAVGNPYTYHWVGSGGYQLTGLYFAVGAIAATVAGLALAFGFAVLGIAVTGHLSAALFVAGIVPMMWFFRRRAALPSFAAAVALLAVYTATIAPPLVFMRALWKAGSVVVALSGADAHTSAFQSHSFLMRSVLGRSLVATLDAMPSESHAYLVEAKGADRLDLWRDAVMKFAGAPLFGQGYGAVDYNGIAYPHDIVLEMAAEGGLIAAMLLMSIVALAPFSSNSAPFPRAYYALMLMTFLVSGYWGGRLLLFGIGMLIGSKRENAL